MRPRRKAFTLVLVAVSIALIGGALVVMTSNSQSILHETARVQRRAELRCLAASALAWGRQHPERLAAAAADDRPIDLDVAALDIPHAAVRLTVSRPDAGAMRVQIDASAGKARGRLRANDRYVLP